MSQLVPTPKPGELIADVPCALIFRPCGRALVLLRIEAEPFLNARLNTHSQYDPKLPPPQMRLVLERAEPPAPRLYLYADFPDLTWVSVVATRPLIPPAVALLSLVASQGIVDLDICLYDQRSPVLHQQATAIRRLPFLASLRDPQGPFASRLQDMELRHWQASRETSAPAPDPPPAEPAS